MRKNLNHLKVFFLAKDLEHMDGQHGKDPG